MGFLRIQRGPGALLTPEHSGAVEVDEALDEVAERRARQRPPRPFIPGTIIPAKVRVLRP